MPTDIYISNLSEDVWDFVQCLPPKARQYEIDENAFLSDRELLTMQPDRDSIFILPYELDADFLAYYQALFQNQRIQVWHPATHSGEICKDVMADTSLWKKLLAVGQHQPLILKSYSTSPQFLAIVDALRQAGVTVSTPESPDKDRAWTVNFLGSKSGIRQTVDQVRLRLKDSQPWLPTGYITHGVENAAMMAASLYTQQQSVVVKTNKGHAGAGVEIARPGEYADDYDTCYQQFLTFFAKEKYWSAFPIVVEQCLEIDEQIGGGNPNCEFIVDDQGQVKLLFVCGMRVNSDGVFKGIEINEAILPSAVLDRLLVFGQELGQEYARLGYRGYFDIDCVFTTDGQLLMSESNIRRTGGTHLYHTAAQLVGEQFMKHSYVFCHNTYELPAGRNYTFKDVYQRLQPLLFSRKNKAGVVIAAANILKQRKLSYIVIGPTKDQAFAIEDEMEKLLQTMSVDGAA